MHATLDFALSPTHNIAGDPADVAATVVREFQDALDACVRGWKQGNDTVLIADNLHEAFGELVLQYFERTLVNEVGGPINFTVLDSAHGQHTLVQMPKAIHQELVNQLELKNVSAAIPFTSDTTKVKPTAPAVKKAPRPMNCWLIFRDAMHKQLKAENPKLTVQQISSRCSAIWRNLSPVEKKPWQAAAQSAKEEHLRQNPDYKYSPRKPGEKKKRRSRKMKQAAAAASAAAATGITAAGLEPFSFPASSEASIFAGFNVATSSTVGGFPDMVNEPFDFGSTTDLFNLNNVDLNVLDENHDMETLRHGRLADEFENIFNYNDTFDFVAGLIL